MMKCLFFSKRACFSALKKTYMHTFHNILLRLLYKLHIQDTYIYLFSPVIVKKLNKCCTFLFYNCHFCFIIKYVRKVALRPVIMRNVGLISYYCVRTSRYLVRTSRYDRVDTARMRPDSFMNRPTCDRHRLSAQPRYDDRGKQTLALQTQTNLKQYFTSSKS